MGIDTEKGTQMKYIAEIDNLEFPIEILDDKSVLFGEECISVDIASVKGQPLYSLLVNGDSYEGYVYQNEDTWQVLLLGQFFSVKITDEREKHLGTHAVFQSKNRDFFLHAPMPGMVISVLVEENQSVEKGAVLVILESMKMQNELRSPIKGKISHIKAKEGHTVEQKQVLLIMDTVE